MKKQTITIEAPPREVPVLALSIEEAAESMGMSESKFKELMGTAPSAPPALGGRWSSTWKRSGACWPPPPKPHEEAPGDGGFSRQALFFFGFRVATFGMSNPRAGVSFLMASVKAVWHRCP